MKTNLYRKLSIDGIKNNKETYLPYMLVSIILTGVYYILSVLSSNKELSKLAYVEPLQSILKVGCVILAIFSLIFLFYTNKFVIKRRQKEFSLYQIFGMEKIHLAKIMAWENLIIFGLTSLLGLIVGCVFYKLVEALFLKLIGEKVTSFLVLDFLAIGNTLILFVGIYVLIYIKSLYQVVRFSPKDLMKEANAGQKAPKNNFIIGLLGLGFLSYGYYLAVNIKNPVRAVETFFIAVLLVMLGTYGVFSSVSIWILKVLKNNKKFYYKAKNFTAVSGLIYRMKQNAIGLGNICILSTAVLVLISTSFSLYEGLDDTIDRFVVRDIVILSNDKSIDLEKSNKLSQIISSYNIDKKDYFEAKTINYILDDSDNKLKVEDKINEVRLEKENKELTIVSLLDEEDANKFMNLNLKLDRGQVATIEFSKDYSANEVSLLGKEYDIKSKIDKLPIKPILFNQLGDVSFLVLNSLDFNSYYDLGNRNSEKIYGFNFAEKDRDKVQNLTKEIRDTNSYEINEKEFIKKDFLGIYSGLFFIGIFLGVIFIIGTGLNIYYKQLTEGYEDRENFKKYRRVGMSEREIKNSIKSQVRIVFFIPLIMAGIHISFAFTIIQKLFQLLGQSNTIFQMKVTIISFIVFSLFYYIMFKLTSKKYYKIISE